MPLFDSDSSEMIGNVQRDRGWGTMQQSSSP